MVIGRVCWVDQGVGCSKVTETFQRMAGNFETSMAYKAATELVCKDLAQPSGYTEPLLQAWRSKVKAA